MNNACITCNNCHITVKFGTKVAYDRPIPHAKQNSKISTDVIGNDIIMSNLSVVIEKHLTSKCFISAVCG